MTTSSGLSTIWLCFSTLAMPGPNAAAGWKDGRGSGKRAVGGDSGPIPAKICSNGKDPADDRKAPGTERERKCCWLSQGTSDLVGAE